MVLIPLYSRTKDDPSSYLTKSRHYPIGVLYDWLTSAEELPWNITVHFQSFPSDQIMKCPNEEIVKRQFMNATKEAIYVRYGDCSRVNSLSVSDSMDLWEGLKKSKRTVTCCVVI